MKSNFPINKMDDDDPFLEWEDDTLLLFDEFDVATSSLQSCSDSQKSNSNSQFSTKGETFFKQIDEDLDYAFALSLQTQYDDEMKENTDINSEKSVVNNSVSSPLSIVDEQWELIDPHPDIHALFIEYDTKFFYGKLKGVEVRWSPRMTLCAGVCCYEGRGGLCSVRLSVPLLKLRPRRDLVETLLHEMIHAYLFVTHNNKDRDGHGPEFLSHMNRINKETGTRITVYHSFHDEVDLYRQHWWKCDGPCKSRRPFFGLVKRAMNRAPGPKDNWWAAHQAACGGNFIKIKEPDNYGKKKTTKRKIPSASESKKSHSDIRSFLKGGIPASSNNNNSNSKPSTTKSSAISDLKSVMSKEDNVVTLNTSEIPRKKTFIPFQGTGQKLGGASEYQKSVPSYVFQKKNEVDFASSSGSSGRILDVTPHSNISKFPRLSNSNNERNPCKDQQPSTSSNTSNKTTRNLIQSPIEKFLSSRTVSGSSGCLEKNINHVTPSNVEGNNASKVSCPVCFILVNEQEINSHLDKCLLNN